MDINNLASEQEVMEHLKMSQSCLWRYRKKGLPSVKIGRKVYYDLDKVVEWFVNLEENNNVE